MSTYWGYRCETCGEYADSSKWRNFDEELEQIYKIRDAFFTFLDVVDPIWYIEVGINILGANGYKESPVEYLRKHKDHVIILINEYGESRPLAP